MGAENISVAYIATAIKQKGHTAKVAFDRALFDDKQYFSVKFLADLFNQKQKMIDHFLLCALFYFLFNVEDHKN